MKVLILGLNYAPEPVGIGPYTAGMAESLVEAGHAVSVVSAKPYYPQWQVAPGHAGLRSGRGVEQGVRVIRVPIYVPRKPTGARRLVHHLSFAARALPALLVEALRLRPEVVIAVAPSLLASAVARFVARAVGARLWLHVQDFEVDAAFATGLLAESGWVGRAARRFEGWSLHADRVSTISPQMCARLANHGVSPDRIVEFRNWAMLDDIAASSADYRQTWNLGGRHVALYSGAIANKQGLELILDAARRLAHRRDLAFVICGNGPMRAQLVQAAAQLDNVQFQDLQPRARLGALLGLASVHLLPQIAGAADLLLPSKLTNMLASGRPVVATAASGTGLAREVDECGLVVAPGDPAAFAAAIERLIDDQGLRDRLGQQAGLRARERWGRAPILARFEHQLRELAA